MLISTIRLNSDYYKKNKQKDIRKELEKAARLEYMQQENNKESNNDKSSLLDDKIQDLKDFLQNNN